MAGVYRPRHPEQTVLYRVLFHHFDRFLAVYEDRFEREDGSFWPIVKEVVECYLDCGNPRCGFARIGCPHLGADFGGLMTAPRGRRFIIDMVKRGNRPKDSFGGYACPEMGRQVVLARPKSALLPDAISSRIEANRQNRGRGGSIV